jgi:hypothetical protein
MTPLEIPFFSTGFSPAPGIFYTLYGTAHILNYNKSVIEAAKWVISVMEKAQASAI